MRCWLVLAALALGACASPTYSEVQSDLPPIERGSGRIVFLGDNYAWYGLLEGVSWNPVITIDGQPLDVDHDEGVYFVAEAPAGRHRIGVDGRDMLTLVVQENVTKYVEMQRYAELNDDFGVRKGNYKMDLVQVSEKYAKARLDGLEFLGVAE